MSLPRSTNAIFVPDSKTSLHSNHHAEISIEPGKINVLTEGMEVDFKVITPTGQKYELHVAPLTPDPEPARLISLDENSDESNEKTSETIANQEFIINFSEALKNFNNPPPAEDIPPTQNNMEAGLLDPEEYQKHQETLPFLKSHFHRLVVDPFIKAGEHIKAHPGWDALAFLTVLPGGINSFCMITGLDPKNLLTGVARMSVGDIFLSAFNAFCYVAINASMHASFYTGLANDFNISKETFNSGPAGKLIILLAFLTGVSAAVAAGSIGYSAFLWLPYGQYTAFLPAGLNAMSTFASRFNGLVKVINRIKIALNNYLNKDRQFEKIVTEKVKYVSDGFKNIFDNFLQDKPLNGETVKALFEEADRIEQACRLQQILDDEFDKTELNASHIEQITELAEENEVDLKIFLGHQDLNKDNLDAFLKEIKQLASVDNTDPMFKPKPACEAETASSWSWFALKTILASYVGYHVFPVFDQKGFDGINTLVDNIAKLAHSNASLHDLTDNVKKLIGAAPGIASLLFYWIHLFDLPDVMKNAFAHLKANPEDIPHAIAVAIAAIFSGSSMQNVATNIANKPDNLFGYEMLDPATQVHNWVIGVSASGVNEKVVTDKLYKAPAPVLPKTSPTLTDVKTYIETQHLDGEALTGLRNNRLFKNFSKPEQDQLRNSQYRKNTMLV